MSANMFGGLTIKELALRTWRESSEDNVSGGGAELAYYFLLALFPMLIFLANLVAFLPGAQENILSGLAKVAPAEALKLVQDTLADVISHRSGGLLSFGVLGTIWAASNGVATLIETLNVAYDAKETRSFWKVRLVAVGLTVALAMLIIGGAALTMLSHKLAEWLSQSLGFGPAFSIIGSIAGYAIGLALVFIGIELVYYFGPNVKQEWKWVTPGAVFAVGAIIAGSLLFSLYLRVAPSNSATYGSLGAVITLMLWLYLIGLALLAGGEINSEIEFAIKGQKAKDKKQKAEGSRQLAISENQ